jgi:hypothetical protein
MPTEEFVCSSLVSVFINPNASSPKIELYLGIVRWRRICSGHLIFYGTWLDDHPFYLCQLKDSWEQVRACSFLWFYWCCAQNQKMELQLPVERELPPENYVKSWDQYKWGVYGEKAFTSNTQRALQTSPMQQQLFWIKMVDVRNPCRNPKWPEI